MPDNALSKFIKDNMKGGLNKAMLGASLAGLATAENKFTGLLKVLKDIATFRLAVGTGLAGGLALLGKGVRDLVKDTGSLEAAFRRLSNIQGLQRVFAPLVGGAEAARKKVAELVQLGAKTPFSFESWGRAAKTLESSTRGMFSVTKALTATGDAAAATGNDLGDTADAIGQVYSALREGRPIAQAVEQLRAMGVVTQAEANLLDTLSTSGAGSAAVIDKLTASIEKHRGGMASLAGDVESVNAAFHKAKENMQAAVGAPFTEAELANTVNLTAALNALAPAAGNVADFFQKLTGGFSTASSGFIKWISESPKLVAVFGGITKAVGVLVAVLTAVGVAAIPMAIGGVNALITALLALIPATGLAAKAVGVLGIALRGLVAASGIGAIIVGLTALTGAALNFYKSLDDTTDALNKATQASLQHAAALTGELNAAQSVNDKHRARVKILQELAAAYEKLNNPNVRGAERAGAESLVRKLTRALKQDRGDAGLADEGTQRFEREEAARARRAEDEYYGAAMEKASPEERLRLMGEYRGVLESRRDRAQLGAQAALDAGAKTREAETTVGGLRAELASVLPDSMIGGILREKLAASERELAAVGSDAPHDSSTFARSMQRRIGYALAGDTNRAGGVTGTAEDMENWRRYAEQREADEANRSQWDSAIGGMKTGQEMARRELDAAARRVALEQEVAALKSIGVERAREEQAIREKYLMDEIRLAGERGDTAAVGALSANLADSQRAGRERERAFAVDAAGVQRELLTQQAEAGGDGSALRALGDLDVFARKLEELRGLGFSDADARSSAAQFARHSIQLRAGESAFAAADTVASLAQTTVGGGGKVAGVHGESVQSVLQEHTNLLKSIQQYLASINNFSERSSRQGVLR